MALTTKEMDVWKVVPRAFSDVAHKHQGLVPYNQIQSAFSKLSFASPAPPQCDADTQQVM